MMDDDFTKLLRRCLAYPANLLLLATIVQQNLTSIEQVTACAEKYGLPEMPEYGLFNWLERLCTSRPICQCPRKQHPDNRGYELQAASLCPIRSE